MRSHSVLAVLGAAVLGVACGVGTGLALDRSSAPRENPLGLTAPFVNQDCTGEALLAVAFGPNRTSLAPAIAEDPRNVRYLATRQSCATAWSDTGHTPRYVAYVGPYPSADAACRVRMTVEHHGDRVIRLSENAKTPVQCLCYLDYRTMPTLRPGMTVSVLDGMYINALQNLLTQMGRRPDIDSTSQYDVRTQAEIRTFQQERGLGANPGVVDGITWKSLISQGCKHYTS